MIDLNFGINVVLVKIYNINGLDSIFGIGDGVVRFKKEKESRDMMRVYWSFNVKTVNMDGKHDGMGSIRTFLKPQVGYVVNFEP